MPRIIMAINNKSIKDNGVKRVKFTGDKSPPSKGRHAMRKCALSYSQISDRILSVKLKGKLFNLTIIVVYVPTAQCTEEENDNFLRQFYNAKALGKSQDITIVRGNENAKREKERG